MDRGMEVELSDFDVESVHVIAIDRYKTGLVASQRYRYGGGGGRASDELAQRRSLA